MFDTVQTLRKTDFAPNNLPSKKEAGGLRSTTTSKEDNIDDSNTK